MCIRYKLTVIITINHHNYEDTNVGNRNLKVIIRLSLS